ncbi:MAG: 3-hydroxyacyl-CoA dehydrogenase family protein [Bryobacteraceae bacterium]|nr:3-hydroxyacyl-CoA dehydrogenase family protein [Bryobacteraceae bacterium]
MDRFNHAIVLGTGMMGPGIAVSLALGGLEAVIVSRTFDRACAALDKAQRHLDELEKHGLIEPGASDAALERLSATADMDAACAVTDLIVESIPENLEMKQALFEHLGRIAEPETVLATNTSGLSVTAIASRCKRPERVMTMHFWNPPHVMPLVELVKGEKTSRPLMEEVRAMLNRCGKTAVIVEKDRRGQLGNRLQMALWREAVHIVEEGIATAEEVYLAAKTGFGLRLPVLGIFEHADAVGLDMVADIMDYVGEDLYREAKAPPLLRRTIGEGRLGVKSGAGFYDWSKKSFDEVRERRDGFLYEFLAARRRRDPE